MNGNVRPDMLRQGIPQQPNMLSLNNPPPFMGNPQQSGQQQIGPSHLGLQAGPNPAMMLANPPNQMNQSQQPQQRYHISMQQAGGRPARPMEMRQGQGGGQPMMGPSGGPVPSGGAPHMAALPHGQPMSFNGGTIPHPPGTVAVRRVPSQTHINPTPGSLNGMSPGVANNINMGMSPQGNMPHLRQVATQMTQQFRLPQQQQPPQGQPMQNPMSPDMPMIMARPPLNPGMAPGRTGSAAQLMNSLSQPQSLSHSIGHHQDQFPNAQLPSQHPQPQVPSPRPGSHSQTHTPSMSMATPGPSHTPVNRSQGTPDNGSMSFMNFSNPQFTQQHNNPRMPNGQFGNIIPSPTPPIPMTDMPQPMSSNIGTPGSTPNRPGFHTTPAQQFERMHNPPEHYPGHFNINMAPPSHVPPRPPSHNNHHPPLPQQQQPQHHHSPHLTDHINSHPQRPPSQPQTIQRPPSQPIQHQTHTPRNSITQLPPGQPLPQRPHHGMQPPEQQIPISGPGPHPIAPKPPQRSMPPPPPNNAPLAQAPSDDTPPSGAAVIPRPSQNPAPLHPGDGRGLIRLLQFSGVLAGENKLKLSLQWWDDLVNEYFTPKAMMKFTLWKDNQRNEAKPFEIGVPILPRFFLVTTQSGVKSMTLTLDGARERMFAPGHAIVECVAAVWTYKYHNGYTVTLRGPLTAHVVAAPPGNAQASSSSAHYNLKFEEFQFDANFHDKFIALESVMGQRVMESPKTPRVRNAPTPTPNGSSSQQQQLEEDKKWEEPRVTIERASIPGEPVNAFGIPQATMRCLELAESVGQMADLITFSTEAILGPLEALKVFAMKIREMPSYNPQQIQNNFLGGINNIPPHPYAPTMHSNASNVPSTPAVTLYSSAPPSVTNPSSNPPPPSSLNSPKNAPPSASNSPLKQPKTIPQNQPSTSVTTVPAASPSVSSGATTNTPALANATLKRKQASDAVSPTAATPEQPPQKRPTRKRGRTTGGG